jgi:hypothetical protein
MSADSMSKNPGERMNMNAGATSKDPAERNIMMRGPLSEHKMNRGEQPTYHLAVVLYPKTLHDDMSRNDGEFKTYLEPTLQNENG